MPLKYRIEFVYSDPRSVIIHLSEKLLWADEDGQWTMFDFAGGGVKDQVDECPRYLIDLLNMDGVESVRVRAHHLLIEIAELETIISVLGSVLYLLAGNIVGGADDLEEDGTPFMQVPDENGNMIRTEVGFENARLPSVGNNKGSTTS
ncbi:MAG: hypothetical protein WDZ82_01460 [Candidatus Paceibacterota bacterium]